MFGSRPKKDEKKVTPIKEVQADTSKLLVRVIEDKTDSLQEALGLTEENCDRLAKAGEKALRDTDTISGAMELLSKSCNHANELAWIMFCIGENRGARGRNGGSRHVKAISIDGGELPDEIKALLEQLLKKKLKGGDKDKDKD